MISEEISRKNKVLLRRKNKFKLFIVCFILGFYINSIYAKIKTYPLAFTVNTQPSYYNQHFFLLSQNNELAKVNLKGQTEWKFSLDPGLWKLIDIKFDKIFLTKKGNLFCYDANYGFKLWGPLALKIKSIYIKYPMIVVLDSSGKISGIDFFSGQKVWATTKVWQRAFFDSKNNLIFGFNKNKLIYMNAASGKIIGKISPGFMLKNIINASNGVLLEDNNKIFYYYQPASGKVRPLKKPSLGKLTAKNQHFFLYHKHDTNKWTSYDIESGKIVWEKEFKNFNKAFEIRPLNTLIGIGNNKSFILLDLAKGLLKNKDTHIKLSLSEIKGTLKYIYYINDKLFLIYPNNIIVNDI